MWRSVTTLKLILNSNSASCEKNILKQFVRNRKPVWAPLAATKLHRVVERQEQDVEESEELKKIYAHYRTVRKSLYEFFKEENQRRESLKARSTKVADEKEFQELVVKVNDEWNAESARLRKILDEEEAAKKEREYVELLEQITKKESDRIKEATILLEEAQKQRPNFIEASNLDKAIEESLNDKVNHNFFIDIQGNKYLENSDGTVDMESETVVGEDSHTEIEKSEALEDHGKDDEVVSGEVINENIVDGNDSKTNDDSKH